MKKRRFNLGVMLATMLLLPTAGLAQHHSSITFQNGAGEPALVKLIGPSARTELVPKDGNREESGNRRLWKHSTPTGQPTLHIWNSAYAEFLYSRRIFLRLLVVDGGGGGLPNITRWEIERWWVSLGQDHPAWIDQISGSILGNIHAYCWAENEISAANRRRVNEMNPPVPASQRHIPKSVYDGCYD